MKQPTSRGHFDIASTANRSDVIALTVRLGALGYQTMIVTQSDERIYLVYAPTEQECSDIASYLGGNS